MPKTRRIRKVGGKRRKSMKGGFFGSFNEMYEKTKKAAKDAHAQAMGHIDTIKNSQQYNAGMSRLNETVNALQKHSNDIIGQAHEYGSRAAASAQDYGSRAAASAQDYSRRAAASAQDYASQARSKMSQMRGSTTVGAGYGKRKGSRKGSRRRHHYQRGGDTTPEEARQIAEDHDAVNALKEELKLNIKTVDELMSKINAPGEHTEEKNQDIAKLEAALTNKMEIMEKIVNTMDKVMKEEMSSKYLKGDTAHHAEQAVKSVQSNATKVLSETQSQITEEVNERAGAAMQQAEKAQEASKGILGKIGEALGFGGDKSEQSDAVAGGRRRKRKGRKTKRKSRKGKRHPKKGQRSKTRKGRLDFITHKGDKYYNRKRHRQTRNRKGKKGRPYASRKRR